MWHDLRFAFRTLSKNPGFAAVAIVALALGIGANATVFSLVNGILFKNLAFPDSERVLYVTSFDSKNPRGNTGISLPDYRDLAVQVKSFEGLGAHTRTRANLSDDQSAPDNYVGARMSINGFSLIGQRPVLGRTFVPEDEKPGAPPVVLLTYSLWETRYGKDASLVGRQIRIDATPTTVIGVMSKGFAFPPEAQFWQPLLMDSAAKRQDRFLTVFGKIRAGITRRSAQAELSTLAQGLATQYPDSNKSIGYLSQDFRELNVRGPIKTVFMVLLGAVGFVLLIACANVANLMLARAVGRAREISIRTALGAGRWRVVRQLLAESLVLSSAGGVIAWLIAMWGIRTFDAAVIPTGKPVWIDFSMDYRAFAYLAAISIGAAVLFGLAPALRLSRLDVNSGLKEGGRAGVGIRGKYLSGILVVAEMTLAVVLLTGAGLMIRSFLWAYTRPAGVNSANVLIMRFDLPNAKYGKAAQQIEFQRSLAERLRALPGVQSAAVHFQNWFTYELEGVTVDPKARPSAGATGVSDGYFETLQVSPLRGRVLNAADHSTGLPVVVVSRTFAGKAWPGADPIGKRLRVIIRNAPQDWMTVVGMIPDILPTTQRVEPDPMIYIPFRFAPQQYLSGMARTAGPPSSIAPAFRREVQSIDPDLPVREIRTLDEQLAQGYWPLRVFGAMFAIFAGIALLLATVGLYAVVANGVNQRTHEIGLRVALGASAASILKMVFKTGMRQMAIGLTLGLAAAFAITRVLSTILVGVSATDPLTFSLVAGLLIAAACLGCAIPARRAMRVDPAIALRHE